MKVSFLLGAGFSRPAGYPLATELSAKILRVQASGIATHPDGQAELRPEFLVHLQTTPDMPFPDPSDDFSRPKRAGADALEAVLNVYGQSHDLSNYEEFYDELYCYRKSDPIRLNAPVFQAECRRLNLHHDPARAGEGRHVEQALSMAFKIFPQLLEQLIKEDPALASAGAGAAYQRFFNLLRTSSSRPRGFFADTPTPAHEFYLHTLNHDLFVEKRLREEDLQAAISYSDGFNEIGSPYYGRLEFDHEFPRWLQQDPRHAHVRMPCFTGKFSGPVQLFKLHGSLDYWSFGVEQSDTGRYKPQVVKKQPWLDHIHLYREVEVDGQLTYRIDFTNYHALFLSGTTAKLEQYADPILFGQLLEHFSLNLANSSILVVIGYGFRDEGINKLLLPFLQDPAKQVIIIGRELPEHPAVRPDMFRPGGLEAYDFAELEALLGVPQNEE